MGLTRLAMSVSNVSDPANSREIRFMVDSGAIHSLVPRQVLSRITEHKALFMRHSLPRFTSVRRVFVENSTA
jgi:hypothetical protein